MERSSGILLPVFSLPSKYGCGSLGQEAYNFIDFLVDAKQSYWQMLPINHTGYGNSPYCCFSSFAGNPAFIDLDILAEEGLLAGLDLDAIDFGNNPSQIDYGKLFDAKHKVLKYAFEHNTEDYSFDAAWLDSYSEFMSNKEGECKEYYKFVQYHFYKQWAKLKKYANEKGIKLIGDVPVYVPLDSADVYAEPHFFMLDEKNLPTEVAGVPPDYFNEDGQLWGNPLYNWEKMKNDGFGWWIRRIDGTLRLFDMVRIDHFRGFDSYWAVPYQETTAKNGRWIQGPGIDFVGVICNWFGKEHFIAEDLGILTDSVRTLLKDSGLPGMKVLEFAFDPRAKSSYLPHNYTDPNCVCYVGTHDNAPVMQWKDEATKEELNFAMEYCNCGTQDFNWGVIKLGMASRANLFVAQLQDYLGLGKEARINVPGVALGNWTFRITKNQITKDLAEKIAYLTDMYGRAK